MSIPPPRARRKAPGSPPCPFSAGDLPPRRADDPARSGGADGPRAARDPPGRIQTYEFNRGDRTLSR